MVIEKHTQKGGYSDGRIEGLDASAYNAFNKCVIKR